MIISYESSKWYVKMWRTRWYLYAILLYFKEYLKIDLGFEYIMNEGELDSDTKEKQDGI